MHTHINVGLKDLPKSHQNFGDWLRVSLDPRRVVVRCLVQSQRTCGTALREGHWSLGGWITAPPKQKSEALDVMETQLILTNWNAGLFEGLELEGFRCYSLHGKKKKPRTVSLFTSTKLTWLKGNPFLIDNISRLEKGHGGFFDLTSKMSTITTKHSFESTDWRSR